MDELAPTLLAALRRYYAAPSGGPAAHAKGTTCRGVFTPSPAAARLTRSAHMRKGPVPVLARFSNASALSNAPDWARDRRGLGVSFGPGTHDIVAVTLPAWFTRTPEDFAAFLSSRQSEFVREHPECEPALRRSRAAPLPLSYAQTCYHAIHAFALINDQGERRFVRWHWQAVAGIANVAPGEAAARGHDFLQDELAARIRSASVTFDLEAELAEPEDPVDDPTVEWPVLRSRVRVGRLALTAIVPGRPVSFDPCRVPDGIECSPDPVLLARPAAYRLAANQRLTASARPETGVAGCRAGPG
jgi:catalase